MKIYITAVHDRLGVISIVNHTNKCGLVEAKNRVDNINITPLILDIPQSDLTRLQKYCTFKIIENNMQNQFEFKPFDQVLVRNTEEQIWKPNFYSFEGYNSNSHVCTNDMAYAQCIPYNESTAHLIGTNASYEEPNSEKKIHVWTSSTFDEWMTEDEFKNFINTAVIHNKDITDFHVMYIR